MIQSFRHSDPRGIPPEFAGRLERILDRSDVAIRPEDMDLPGFRFHRLQGDRQDTYTVDVSRNWRLTFEFDGENAIH